MRRALPALVLHAALCLSKLGLHTDAVAVVRMALALGAQLHEAGLCGVSDGGADAPASVRLAAVGFHMQACELYASARPIGSSSAWSRSRCTRDALPVGVPIDRVHRVPIDHGKGTGPHAKRTRIGFEGYYYYQQRG